PHLGGGAAPLPIEVRGRFFATDSAITSFVGVGTLLLCATLFARLPGWLSFSAVYALAIAGSLVAVTSLLRLPDAPPPAPVPTRTLHRDALRLLVAPGPFRFYLGLSLLNSAATSSIAAFTAYYLKVEAGFSQSRILALTAVVFAGQIAAGVAIRAALDRQPLRRFFRIAAVCFCGVELFWLALLSSDAPLANWLPLPYFLLGIGAGTLNTAHFTLLPELSEVERRPISIAVFTATLGLFAGLAPILWGLLLNEPGPAPGLRLGPFAPFFAWGSPRRGTGAERNFPLATCKTFVVGFRACRGWPPSSLCCSSPSAPRLGRATLRPSSGRTASRCRRSTSRSPSRSRSVAAAATPRRAPPAPGAGGGGGGA